MSRVTLDSDILVYAALEPQTEKGTVAARIIEAAAARGVLTAQALGEFVNVVRRRAPDLFGRAVEQVDAMMQIYVVAPTDGRVVRAAGSLALRRRLQFWDAVIWTAAREAGATVFLSEDLQDGLALDGMRVINPFNPANDGAVAALLEGPIS